MKKLLVSLLILPVIAFSQTSSDKIEKIPLEGYCMSGSQLKEVIRNYKEIPVLIMQAHRLQKNGETTKHDTVLFLNPQTGTWTLFEEHKEKGYCVVAVGEQARPFQNQSMNLDKSLPKQDLDWKKYT